eukprot:CAMPEP_0180426708 /NCGR_PEP_ID=MMETSP1036_2-20121128/5936_1 /TAXON_ID=632150 /ORGANISM="Azadinium spinosum, Strain 3D9" /LENGTH=71 /DNA_ID=CAMNT_0022432273 /DNA_START=61 /DNA_END=272 /DNA_ORIENTATION=+
MHPPHDLVKSPAKSKCFVGGDFLQTSGDVSGVTRKFGDGRQPMDGQHELTASSAADASGSVDGAQESTALP